MLKRLGTRGLTVTKTMLDNDVRDKYLPSRPWESWVLNRASRLYRLRKLGLRGDLLRIFLFVHDGWGWDGIRSVVSESMKKNINATQTGIRETIREPNKRSLEFMLDEAVSKHHDHLISRLAERHRSEATTRSSTMAFVWGMGLFGEPLSGGSLESTAPLFRALYPTLNEDQALAHANVAEELMKFSGVTHKDMLELVDAADEDLAKAILPEFWTGIRQLRHMVHIAAIAEDRRGHATNPLSFFGYGKQAHKEDVWRKMLPQRFTAAQILATYLGSHVLAACLLWVIMGKVFETLSQASEPLLSNT